MPVSGDRQTGGGGKEPVGGRSLIWMSRSTRFSCSEKVRLLLRDLFIFIMPSVD